MRQPFRLLVTGSRNWNDVRTIEQALAVILHRHPEGVLLVHGACSRGANAIAAAKRLPDPGLSDRGAPRQLDRPAGVPSRWIRQP